MDVERFETLALAYGGDLRRWPEAERNAAEAFVAGSPEAARAVLREAGDLDAVLDGWASPAPSAALRERVLAAAPKDRTRVRPLRHGLGLWLSGAGFAAVAAAGVVVGFAASSAAVSNVRADTLLSATLPNESEPALTPFTVGAFGTRAT